jgi:threonine dehydrogenase-like Zn-dependent dehydrogenase
MRLTGGRGVDVAIEALRIQQTRDRRPKLKGATQIIAIDAVPERLEMLRQLGTSGPARRSGRPAPASGWPSHRGTPTYSAWQLSIVLPKRQPPSACA